MAQRHASPALLHQLLHHLDVAGAPVVIRRSIRDRQFDEAGQRMVKQHQRQGSGKRAERGGNGVGAAAQPIQAAA